MVPIYNLIRNGAAAEVTNDVPDLPGRPATDLDTVLDRDFGKVTV